MISSVSRRKSLSCETILVLIFCTGAAVYAAGFVFCDLFTVLKIEKTLLYIRDFALGSLLISSFSILFFKYSKWLKISWALAIGFEILSFLYIQFGTLIGELRLSSLALEMLGSFATIAVIFLLRVMKYEKSFI